MPLLRLVTAAAMVVMVVMAAATADMAAMVATGVAAMDTARGRLRPSPATAMAVMAADMVATAVVAMVVMAVAMAATGVSYHRRRRNELSEKQNHKKSHC